AMCATTWGTNPSAPPTPTCTRRTMPGTARPRRITRLAGRPRGHAKGRHSPPRRCGERGHRAVSHASGCAVRAALSLALRLDLDAQLHGGLEAVVQREVDVEVAAVEFGFGVGAADFNLLDRVVVDALEGFDVQRQRAGHAVQREFALHLLGRAVVEIRQAA